MNKRLTFAFLFVSAHVLLGRAPVLAEPNEIRIAENMLLYQRSSGGWPNNYDADARLDNDEKAKLRLAKHRDDATFDNGATHREVRALSKAYTQTRDDRFKAAALRGIEFMLAAQYDQGGWPQRYPNAKGYSKHITFNDNAMIGVMTVLRDVAEGRTPYRFIDEETRNRAAAAVQNGIGCILNCQIVVDGVKTVWCAQHDAKNFAPAKARSFELPSLSGGESVRVVQFLMQIEKPDRQVVDAIESAIDWYRKSKLRGIRLVREEAKDTPKGFDKRVIEDSGAPPMWARFYDIETNLPIFCSRDGIPRKSLADISYERRNGYSWLGYYARDLLGEDYPSWQARIGPTQHATETDNDSANADIKPPS
ncbi:MAG: pectate lyase [Planctomycetota bacterium]